MRSESVMVSDGRTSEAGHSGVSAGGARRPRVLLLVTDVLFPQFFPQAVLTRLTEVAEWWRHSGREDSAELRAAIAQADALMTTWHSPFLRAEMFGKRPRVRLIAHCGGELKSRMEEEVFNLVTVTNAAGPMADPVAEM